MIVLDTNVLSELMRADPSPAVVRFVADRPAASLFTTTVTEAEILYGLELLPHGRRRDALRSALTAVFESDFKGRVLPFDSSAARAYAELAVARRRAGRPISQMDAQIAAIAASREASIATRNVRDFEGCGVVIVDPFE